MRTWLALSMALILGASVLAACAPRQSKTHYNRWAEETEQRKAEEAKEEAEKQAQAEQKTQPAPRPTPPPPDYGSPPPGETPAITRTATRSRVIRPAVEEETQDEDVIY